MEVPLIAFLREFAGKTGEKHLSGGFWRGFPGLTGKKWQLRPEIAGGRVFKFRM
jgi:hypothetical protein